MDTSGINGVVHEALTLANHAARTGALPANSRIFDQIETVTKARDRGERPDIAPLVAEMVRVSGAARITVAQLMQRGSTLGRLRRSADVVTPFLIGFMTLLLTLYLAFQSSELHKADLALREYQELVTERLQEKIYLAWKMYRYERVLNLKGPALAQLDGYQKLVDDAKRLYVKRDAVQQMLLDTAVIRYVPQLFQYHGPCWLQSAARTLNADSSVACRDATAGAAGAPAGLLPEYVPADKASDRKAAFDCSINHSTAGTADKVSGKLSDAAAPADNRLDLDDYVQSVSCFVRSLNIAAYDEPVDRQIYATRTKVHLLVSWLLPGLYGLLGACVFVMRALLRTTGRGVVPGNSRDARIVDMLSLLLRVSLGGLAGIIIGWFSVPTESAVGSSAIAVSSIPFGMAFLAGYSIESLFAMLDRLNKTLGQQDEGAGQKGGDGPKSPAGPPASPAAPAEPPVASVSSVVPPAPPPAPPPAALPVALPDASAAAQGKT